MVDLGLVLSSFSFLDLSLTSSSVNSFSVIVAIELASFGLQFTLLVLLGCFSISYCCLSDEPDIKSF